MMMMMMMMMIVYQFWKRQLIKFQNKHFIKQFVIEQLEPKEKPSGGIKLFGLCR